MGGKHGLTAKITGDLNQRRGQLMIDIVKMDNIRARFFQQRLHLFAGFTIVNKIDGGVDPRQ
ncbi:hypothetical protein D3C81_2331940 [compost metagenome]